MSESTQGDCWYALQVKSRHEKSVSTLLTAKRYESFVPIYRERHRWADRMKTVELPLFPGYVFCRFQAVYRYPVLATPGVVNVVRMGDEPARVDHEEIEALKRTMQARLEAQPYPHLAAGQKVRLSDGPLAGITGTIVEVCKTPRLVLSVTLLQRSVLVEIDQDWVSPVTPAMHATANFTETAASSCRKMA